MLEGIRIFDLKKNPDERGTFTEIMRNDWKDFLGTDEIVQVNSAVNYPGVVKAWHMHAEGKIEYFLALRGLIKVCVYDEQTKEIDEIILTNEKPQILRVPGKFWHGIKILGIEPSLTITFTTKLYDYSKPDEVRRPWDDKNIIPNSINGNVNDKRVGKPWDWFLPPHK